MQVFKFTTNESALQELIIKRYEEKTEKHSYKKNYILKLLFKKSQLIFRFYYLTFRHILSRSRSKAKTFFHQRIRYISVEHQLTPVNHRL